MTRNRYLPWDSAHAQHEGGAGSTDSGKKRQIAYGTVVSWFCNPRVIWRPGSMGCCSNIPRGSVKMVVNVAVHVQFGKMKCYGIAQRTSRRHWIALSLDLSVNKLTRNVKYWNNFIHAGNMNEVISLFTFHVMRRKLFRISNYLSAENSSSMSYLLHLKRGNRKNYSSREGGWWKVSASMPVPRRTNQAATNRSRNFTESQVRGMVSRRRVAQLQVDLRLERTETSSRQTRTSNKALEKQTRFPTWKSLHQSLVCLINCTHVPAPEAWLGTCRPPSNAKRPLQTSLCPTSVKHLTLRWENNLCRRARALAVNLFSQSLVSFLSSLLWLSKFTDFVYQALFIIIHEPAFWAQHTHKASMIGLAWTPNVQAMHGCADPPMSLSFLFFFTLGHFKRPPTRGLWTRRCSSRSALRKGSTPSRLDILAHAHLTENLSYKKRTTTSFLTKLQSFLSHARKAQVQVGTSIIRCHQKWSPERRSLLLCC